MIRSTLVFGSLALLSLPVISGCNQSPKSSYGFTLPDGDAAAGQQIFVASMCHECHTVAETELPDPEFAAETRVRLGGKVSRIQTYGELVTSIINPSHRLASGYPVADVAEDGQSKMMNYNDVMTVSELIDLVAFLQSRYELKPWEPTPYDMYQYGP